MNDRFRYRVYYKPHNKVYNVICLNCDRQKEIIIEYKGSTAVVEWKNCEILQSTGFHDKNAKLIYDGDIVRLKAKNGMTFDYAVKFKNYCFILEYINGRLKGTKARNFAKQYAQPQRMYEHGYMVIGNVYENKELLDE